MASPYQQQVFQRKLLYIGLILVLFTGSLVWRRNVVDDLAGRLAIREESRGEVELTGAAVRLTLTGLRGLATCVLWNEAIDKQKKNQWNELEVLVRLVTKLQPHFITPWLFQSWNLSYNVSVESDRVRDKYFYIARGVQLLYGGERQNLNNPDLRWSLGFFLQNKIIQSDETNVHRSLFQLSLIKPSERDPSNFRSVGEDGKPVVKADAFAKFARAHPQLVRRLRNGIRRETQHARRQQFTCQTPEEVVQFLEDNWEVPSLYEVPSRRAGVLVTDVALPLEDRFPLLPPPPDTRVRAGQRPVRPPERVFDAEALTDKSELGDDVDANIVAHAWYCYAQEPIPLPGDMPGSTREITDRATQRKPKHMTTLIFRHYPAQGRRFYAERLQAEGWYDGEGWGPAERQDRGLGWDPIKEALLKIAPAEKGRIGGGRKWSEDAWTKAKAAWQKHGEDNHILFPSVSAEENMRELAKRYWERVRPGGLSQQPSKEELARMTRRQRREAEEAAYSGRVTATNEEGLDAQRREELHAAQFMFEYRFYRQVSNFDMHYQRALVESRPETVAIRKLFYRAEQLASAGSYSEALEVYTQPPKEGADPVPFPNSTEFLNPLEAWRKLVLLRPEHERYADHDETQQQAAEIQIAYLDLDDLANGGPRKTKLAKLAPYLPLPLPTNRAELEEVLPRPFVLGPFDVTGRDGEPLISKPNLDRVLERKGRLPRPQPTSAPPERVKRPSP
jgi:hypothetical protein